MVKLFEIVVPFISQILASRSHFPFSLQSLNFGELGKVEFKTGMKPEFQFWVGQTNANAKVIRSLFETINPE